MTRLAEIRGEPTSENISLGRGSGADDDVDVTELGLRNSFYVVVELITDFVHNLQNNA